MLTVGTIVYNADGDAGSIKEVDPARRAPYFVRWDGFDLNPYSGWVAASAFAPQPPTAWERMRALGIVR